jgi:hypothetical protein
MERRWSSVEEGALVHTCLTAQRSAFESLEPVARKIRRPAQAVLTVAEGPQSGLQQRIQVWHAHGALQHAVNEKKGLIG